MNANFLPRGLIAALQFLSRLPVPQLPDFSPADQHAATPWYPVVGLIIGCIVAGSAWAGSFVTPLFAALVTVVVWVWITGALHLDGLADAADGLGAAHRDPERFLEVVKDPHVGSFGAVALVLVIVAKLVLLADLAAIAPTTVWLPALALVPAWARWAPLVWRNLVAPLGEGRARIFSGTGDWRWVAVHGVLLGGASLWFQPALLAAFVICPIIAAYWHWRLGGMSGDCHGASIEITEVLLLICLAVLSG